MGKVLYPTGPATLPPVSIRLIYYPPAANYILCSSCTGLLVS